MGEYERAAFGRPLILFVLFLQGAQRVRFLSFRRGRCPHRPADKVPCHSVGAATWGRPYGKASFSGCDPLGEFHKGGPEPPFWSFQGDRVLRERGKFEIPLSLSGSLVTSCPHRKSLARRRNIP